MKVLKIFFSIVVLGTLTAQAQISPELKTQLTAEMKIIGAVFQNQYAPKQWKERHLGWSVEKELNTALTKIESASSVREYRDALADFVQSTQDYHVSIQFYSTEAATLAFSVRTIEGKTLIVGIDRARLSKEAFPFAVGDELLAIDGKKVEDLLKELQLFSGPNIPATDLAIADMYLLYRSGRANMKVPQGPVLLTFKRAKETEATTFQLVWEYRKEQVPGKTKESLFETTPKVKDLISMPMMVSQQALAFTKTIGTWEIGEKESFLPELGEKVWQSADDSIFEAYIYLSEKGKLVGVLRIPSYSPEDEEAALKEIAAVLERFEKNTSAMVIDQVNNPGGSVFYLYALVSMMITDSATTPQHRMALDLSRVNNAASLLRMLGGVKNDAEAKKILGESFSGFPVTYQLVVNIREYANFMIDQWAAGKKLTEPHYIWGVDRINPSAKVKYTKPIVIVINELDFSGGDFFPAIMQDNKRATIVGARTAGAGGYVDSITFPNSFGFSGISYTGSIAERADKNPIENLGVTPDVEIKLTVEDVRKGFTKYLDKVKSTIDSLMK